MAALGEESFFFFPNHHVVEISPKKFHTVNNAVGFMLITFLGKISASTNDVFLPWKIKG